MATEVGSVYIRVRAITDKVAPDIQKAFSSLNAGAVASAGENVGKTFSKAIGKNINGNVFTKVGEALSSLGGEAGTARNSLYEFTKAGNIGGVAIATLLGSISSLIGGFAGLGGAVLGAIPSIMGLVGALVTLKAGIAVGQLALEGIMGAVQKATTSYVGYGKTLAEILRIKRDLKFATEDAALSEKRAFLNLQKARSSLIRTQDMPANSMARQEALLAYQEADLAYRKAKEKKKDAIAEAKAGTSGTGGVDPFAGLTKSQTEFAKFLISLKPKMDELKEAAAKGFLPILKENIKGLMKDVFPTFKQGIKDIATGLGGLTTNLSNAIRTPENVALLGAVMKSIGDNLPIMGTIMGNIYGSMLSVLKLSDPLVKDFLNFLNTKTKTLDDWLKSEEGVAAMKDFFNKSKKVMDDLWIIIENTFGGIGAVVNANLGPGTGGQIMLDWLKDVTGGWAAMDDTVAGRDALKQYFIDTAKNSTAILDSTSPIM